MARIRSIKPEYWDDRKLARCASRDARLLYIALWNLADEHGRLNGDPQWIKGQVFPYDNDLDSSAVAKLLEELQAPALGAVIAYEVDGDPYLFLPKLARHQRLEPEKVRSRLPAPPDPSGPEPDRSPPPAWPTGRGADESASHRADQSESGAYQSERRADESAPSADKSALLYVAGSREHVAGSRGSPRGRVHDAPTVPHELPDDFTVTDAMRRWAHQTYPGLDLDFETAQFCRHHRSAGTKRKSWPDAWQKWVADSHKRLSSSRASPGARNSHQPTHDEFEALRENWARPLDALDAQEAGNDPRRNGGASQVHLRGLPAAEN